MINKDAHKTKKVVVHHMDKEPERVRIFGLTYYYAENKDLMFAESDYSQAHRCVNGLTHRQPTRL